MINWEERKFTGGKNTADSDTGTHLKKLVTGGVAPEDLARAAMKNTVERQFFIQTPLAPPNSTSAEFSFSPHFKRKNFGNLQIK